MIHIAIDDYGLAILHEETFVVEIILKSWVFNRSNMVWTDVEKNTNVKGQTVNPFHQISLTGNFHNQVGPIIGYCLSHHGKKIQALWRCQGRFKEVFTIQRRIHSRQHSWSVTLFQNMVSKIGRCCLSLSPCEGQ